MIFFRVKRSSTGLLAAIAQLAAAAPALAGQASEPPKEIAQHVSNKTVALAFQKAVAAAEFEAARQYLGEYYIEHDPEREDGIPGLQRGLDADKRRSIRREVTPSMVIADGDFVVTYSSVLPIRKPPPPRPDQADSPADAARSAPPPPKPYLTSEIFRLQNGKVVEHWITIQP